MLILEGGAVAPAGVLVGRLLPGRRVQRPPKPLPPPKPVCGCGHSISFHADGQKACAWMGETHYRSGVGAFTPKCRCLNYVGPMPMPDYFAPEIGG